MPHPILGPDAVRRDVFVAPSRLARETALIAEVYSQLEPHLDHLVDEARAVYELELDDSVDDDVEALTEAVAAIRALAAGGEADADNLHEIITTIAAQFEENDSFADAVAARIAWLAAAWLSLKAGRWLRAGEADIDPWERFGGLVNVLALNRFGADYRELLDELESSLNALGEVRALDTLFPALEQLLDLVGYADVRRGFGTVEGPRLDAELRRFAAGDDIDVAAVHRRIESLASNADELFDMEAVPVASAAWAVARWLRMRSGGDFGYEPDEPGHHSSMSPRRLTELIAWARTGRPAKTGLPESFDPELDQFGVLRELKALHRIVTGADLSSPPPISGQAYATGIESVVERLSALPRPRRLQALFDWISPLLDEVAWENRDFLDEPEMTTAQAVERFHRIADGADDDPDAVHCHLTSFALVESEDQDSDMHVRSQAAFLAADWLRLHTGRDLRIDDELIDDQDPVDLAAMVNTLAWSRSRQVVLLPEYVDEYPDIGRDVLSPLIELKAMREDLTPPD